MKSRRDDRLDELTSVLQELNGVIRRLAEVKKESMRLGERDDAALFRNACSYLGEISANLEAKVYELRHLDP